RNNVVHADEKGVLQLAEPQQKHSGKWSAAENEWLLRFFFNPCMKIFFTFLRSERSQVLLLQPQPCIVVDDLYRLSILEHKSCAENLMTFCHSDPRLFQCR